ncbi:MAG: DUF5635 domain-containing protein [Actinomycetaceae bacterium]|nr:DUF5635 domain-containing protein [Actinomycetaceae bacterium]MDY6082254.1 DUF5635 domain-containing protein [Actinomycetaceae bacterium]
MDSIVPLPRQHDYRVSIILYLLFNKSFVTLRDVAEGLQSDDDSARLAIDVAQQSTVGSEPLIVALGDAWILNDPVREILSQEKWTPSRVAAYLTTNRNAVANIAIQWLAEFPQISTGELMRLCGVSRGIAQRALQTLQARGDIMAVGSGRSAAYRLCDAR